MTTKRHRRTSGTRITGKGPLHSTAHIVFGNDPKPEMEPGDIYATLKNYREKAFAILPEYKTPTAMSEIEFAAFKVVCFANDLEAALEANDAPKSALIAMHLHDAMMQIRIREERSLGGDAKADTVTASDLARAYGREFVHNNKDAWPCDGIRYVQDKLKSDGKDLTEGYIRKIISPLFSDDKRKGGRRAKPNLALC